MIPYVPPPAISIGPLAIHAFGMCAAAALIAGYLLIDRRALRYGLDSARAGRVYVLTVLAGLLGGFLWSRVEGAPGISSTGLALASVACLTLLLRPERAGLAAFRNTSFWNGLDLYFFAFPFVYAIVRSGCFLAHDHIGNPTGSWLGVEFPGGTRYDLGLLYALSSAAIAGGLIQLSRKPLPAGTVTVTVVALLGLFRLAILPLGPATAGDYAAAAGAPAILAGIWWFPRATGCAQAS